MAATVMGGGTDNNQLKVAAEDSLVVGTALETATAMEMAIVTATTKMRTPTMPHQ